MEKEFLRMKLADLVPYENNPRHNEEAVDATIASMQQCGNIDPIEVDENNVILSGHTRRLALLKMGYEESDVIVVSGLSEHQKKKYRILANKTNEFAGWDFEKLEQELDGLDFEGFDFGFLIGGSESSESENPYTKTVNIPQYEPSGELVPMYELTDDEKCNELLREIESSDVNEEEKKFLREAAHRHTVFNYKKIAEYYATASEEMQKLMESSALVVIDINDAIAKGYAVLRKSIEETAFKGA